MWNFVRRRFSSLLSNLELTEGQIADGEAKTNGIVSALNRAYRDDNSATDHAFKVGSWGKGTAVRPSNDIDVFFLPPIDVFHTFNARLGNKQSQLLQEVRSHLSTTFSQTQIRGDGQVVVVDFNSITIEVIPAFGVTEGGYYICDTNDGGRWKHVDADGELILLQVEDDKFSGNLRKAVKMLKQWKRHCNVPIKSFHIERLVMEWLNSSTITYQDEFWFDWLIRDVFGYMIGRAGQHFDMPGLVFERIYLGEEWLSRTRTAYENAVRACVFENNDMNVSAGVEWQKIFGSKVPTEVK